MHMNQEKFAEAFKSLTPRRREVLLKLLAGETDAAIAQSLHIHEGTVRKQIAEICLVFGLISQSGERYSKRAELVALFAKYRPELLGERTPFITEEVTVAETAKVEETTLKAASFVGQGQTLAHLNTLASQPDPNFVGRESASAHLNILINQGAKVILIQSPGGIGKTTLAKKYLREKFGESVLEFPIAKETKDIASVESLIEERLRQLGEEPGREFFVSLERLKQKLKTQAMGVLIDNLEPALDESGRFVEEHRRYVELLRVLADDAVKSLTLITSREPLGESVDFIPYPLPSLSESAWQEVFNNRGITTDTPALAEIYQAFWGNALAMKILCAPIERYFNGDVAAYWQEHKSEDGLFTELAVENLIKEQFNRLRQIYPEVYRLLCRLGCYRYQDVPRIPIEGLFCLLWDVPEAQHRRVIQSLRDRSLVEFCNGEYWLHPVIRAEASARLRATEDWETANIKAAEFWTESVKTVETIEDALRAFEAYHHYLDINAFEKAGDVIVNEQLGLTSQKMGKIQKSQENFDKAIQLFSEMEAPKQVEKVRRSMENGG